MAEEMDRLLDLCLLQALRTTVKDKQLPIAAGVLWNQHLLPARPLNSHIDLRASSHKKLSKFLEAKAADGLITVKPDKATNELALTGVIRRHEALREFQPDADVTMAARAAADARSGGPEPLELLEVARPSPALVPLFEAVGADPSAMYDQKAAMDVVWRYVQKEDLDARSPIRSHVLLNVLLCDALFKGVIKNGEPFPVTCPKGDLSGHVQHRMLPQTTLRRGQQQNVRRGALPPVRLSTETRPGGHKATRLSGMELFLIDADALADELSHKFAASCSLSELPGQKTKGMEIVLQGAKAPQVLQLLTERYGVPAKYVEVHDKFAKKKKR